MALGYFMSTEILLPLATLLIGWFLARLGGRLDVRETRRRERNELLFHLIQLHADIAKRQIIDDLVLSRSDKADRQHYREEARKGIPDEFDAARLESLIQTTATYDPLLANEVKSTLLPATALDRRLREARMNTDEFELLLRMLTFLDRAIAKRLQLLAAAIAQKNGWLVRRRIVAAMEAQRENTMQSLERQRKLAEQLKATASSSFEKTAPTPCA